MKKQFQSPDEILRDDEACAQIDAAPQAFGNSPRFELHGENGKNVVEVTQAEFAHVDMKVRGEHVYITGINDVRQNKNAGWVLFLNGQIPSRSHNHCITRNCDQILWVFLPMPVFPKSDK